MANKKSTKSKKNKKQEFKFNFSAKLVVACIMLIGGAFGGFYLCKTLTKNDVFEICGEQNIVLQVGQDYEEQGAKAIILGQDLSQNVIIENNINNAEAGVYYVKYSINHLLYKNIYRYRYVEVVEVSA